MKLVLFTALLAIVGITLFTYITIVDTQHATRSYKIEVCRDKVMGDYEKKWNAACIKNKLNYNCKMPDDQLSQAPSWETYAQQMNNCSK